MDKYFQKTSLQPLRVVIQRGKRNPHVIADVTGRSGVMLFVYVWKNLKKSDLALVFDNSEENGCFLGWYKYNDRGAPEQVENTEDLRFNDMYERAE